MTRIEFAFSSPTGLTDWYIDVTLNDSPAGFSVCIDAQQLSSGPEVREKIEIDHYPTDVVFFKVGYGEFILVSPSVRGNEFQVYQLNAGTRK